MRRKLLLTVSLLLGTFVSSVAALLPPMEGTQLIDGIYYRLQNGWSESFNDPDGTYHYTGWVQYAAYVTYDPDNNPMNTSSVETYKGDITISDKVSYGGVEYTVVRVDEYAFSKCQELTSVKLPSSVKIIGYEGFSYCTSLTSVEMPGVMSLSDYVFRGSKIQSLTLPQSLVYVSSNTFYETSQCMSIDIASGNPYYTSEDGILFNADKSRIVGYPKGRSGSFTIPSTVTTVADGTFNGCTKLTEIVIPATVTRVNNAFSGCSNLKSAVIKDGDTELTLGSGDNCWNSIYENEYSHEVRPLFYNTGLTTLYVGRNLKYSDKYSSPIANTGINKVTFGSKVTKIPDYTFYNCWSMQAVDIKGGLSQWCKFDLSDKYRDPFGSATGMAVGGSEPSVTFDGQSLSGVVALDEGVTNIPIHALKYGCTGITNISLPASLTTIADGAFKELVNLESVSLPASNTNFSLVDNVLYDKASARYSVSPCSVQVNTICPILLQNLLIISSTTVRN